MESSQLQEVIIESCAVISIGSPGWKDRLQLILSVMLECDKSRTSHKLSVGKVMVLLALSEALSAQSSDIHTKLESMDLIALAQCNYVHNSCIKCCYKAIGRYASIACKLFIAVFSF